MHHHHHHHHHRHHRHHLSRIVVSLFLSAVVAIGYSMPSKNRHEMISPSLDAIFFATGNVQLEQRSLNLKRLWVSSNGEIHPEGGKGLLEVAATLGITEYEHKVGAFIVSSMTYLMPSAVFERLSEVASVGLFTSRETTTAFPEYELLRDRTKCQGTCSGGCVDTCTADGRKYDSLSGVGGVRATCLSDNFMCSSSDPYSKQYSVLVHEFGHTVHMIGLYAVHDYYDKVPRAYENARSKRIWDPDSYAMTTQFEYFAEATAVFFQSNRHPISSGGMNRCGRQQGFCQSEAEARSWLQTKDPMLFEILSYTYTNFRPQLTTKLEVCVVQ